MDSLTSPNLLAQVVHTLLNLALVTVWAGFLFVLPGYALFDTCFSHKRLSPLETIAIAAGVSVSLYPLLYLWTSVLGLYAGLWIAWLPGSIGVAYALWKISRKRFASSARLNDSASAAMSQGAALQPQSHDYVILASIVAVLLATRLIPIRDMVAPAWGDSVHHAMIAQLLLDHGSLFQSWVPYAPIASFTYHFGFHTNIAVWAIVTGQSVPQAMIEGGQALNIIAVLALYPLAVRLGGSRLAGVAAVTVAGLLSQQPAMYVNWGRYTQLTAQIVLPVLVWALDVWWTESQRPTKRLLVIISILASGIALTHYRVAVLAALAGVAWGLWALWILRANILKWLVRTAWLVVAAGAALMLILPYANIVRNSRLAESTAIIAERSKDAANMRVELAVWSTIGDYYSTLLIGVALIALVMALWLRRRMAVPLTIWCALVFLAASPFLLNIAGTGIVTNFLVLLGLYIPMALLVGWLASQAWMAASSHEIVRAALIALAVIVIAVGIRYQLDVVDPTFQLVTQDDIVAFEWIDENLPDDSRFLVNTFLAFNERMVAGSDAGWWLPYYTGSASNLPPILYSVEKLSDEVDRSSLTQLVEDIHAAAGDALRFQQTLCDYDISHIYLGQRQGQAGVGDTQLIEPSMLSQYPDVELLFNSGNAQVWSFDRDLCPAP